MNPLAEILFRNQGQVLTPELIWGIVKAQEFAEPESVFAGIAPGRRPEDPYPMQDDPRLVINDRNRVGEWIAQRIGVTPHWGGFGAIGLLDHPGSQLVAGALLNNITSTSASAHVAFAGKYSLKRILLLAFFDYAFNQLDLDRLTGLVDSTNEDALRFDMHLGFEHEFTIPNGNAGDVHQLVMWRDKCRWIQRGKNHG